MISFLHEGVTLLTLRTRNLQFKDYETEEQILHALGTNPSTLKPLSEDRSMETLKKPWTENSDDATTVMALDQGFLTSLHTSVVTNREWPK